MDVISAKLVPWLDSHRELRVLVHKWLYQQPIEDQFIVYPNSPRLLWNYLKRVGLRAVVNKIKSRLSESRRNKKVAGIGIGSVISLSDCSSDPPSCRKVLFFASNHNPDAECLVLDKRFIVDLPTKPVSTPPVISQLPDTLSRLVAWSRFSGFQVDDAELQLTLTSIAATASDSSFVCTESENVYTDLLEADLDPSPKPTAVLFGLGNYAKTAIIPNIKHSLHLQRIHEIDPDQFSFLPPRSSLSLDTSPFPREGLAFDAWFIAGYHHTHAELAVHALRQGAAAVIEKPLATTRDQYENFIRELKRNPGSRFYLCFHKRYSDLHLHFKKDSIAISGYPIDMHCIVYEIPLPVFHWYNWPNSGSRVISNGCHWIDYFMYINNYCEIEDCKKWLPRGSDVVVQIKLRNGAYFSMSLTDSGSQRVGVRDYIELRANGQTFKMIDGEHYIAENCNRVFNRVRVNPLKVYSRMYRKIGADIARCAEGDSLESLRSSEVALMLEAL